MYFSRLTRPRKRKRRRALARLEVLESRRVLATYFVDSAADTTSGVCAADNAAGNSNCTIRLAIQEAEANPGADTIQIPDGNYLIDSALGSFDLANAQDTAFIGNTTDASAVVIDGTNQSRAFDIFGGVDVPYNVSFQGLTIQNGIANDGSGGGAINAGFDVNLSLDNVVVQNNVAAEDIFNSGNFSSGGGIQASGNVTIVNSIIQNNIATDEGGGIDFAAFDSPKTLSITDSTVSGNTTGDSAVPRGYGGGVIIRGGSSVAILDTVTVTGNSSGDSGGGVYVQGGSITVTDTDFTNNDALGSDSGGGGLYVLGQGLTSPAFSVTGGTFDSNTAVSGAGGFESVNNPGTIDGTTFTSNQVTGPGTGFDQGGGAIAIISTNPISSPQVTINNATVRLNSAPAGGGIAVVDASVAITHSLIQNNTTNNAQLGGGGIGAVGSAGGSPLVIDHSDILGNTSAGDGGGIGAVDIAVQITNSTIDGNRATGSATGRGGGLGLLGLAQTPLLTLESSTISNNLAQTDGGGLAVVDGAIQLTNVTVTENTAFGLGGGVAYSNDSGAVQSAISFSTIADNSGLTSGDNLAAQGGAAVGISNSIFATGTCAIAPGAASSAGFNIDSGTSCGFTQPTDRSTTDPLLGLLQDNGGAVFTLALGVGSPAIDTADSTFPATDARGIARPQDGDGDTVAAADVGAFELAAIAQPRLTVSDVFFEEASGNVNVLVTLDTDASGPFTVNFATVDGTATDPGDYQSNTGTISFLGNAGEQQTIALVLVDDNVAENDEQFQVALSNPSISVDVSDIGFVSIFDDDSATLTVSDLVEVNEDTGAVTIGVTLSGQTDAPFTVDVSTLDISGGAVAGIDYTAASSTLTFTGNNGETQNFIVTVAADSIVELDESFAVEVRNITAGIRDIQFDNFADRVDITSIGQFSPSGISANDVALFTPDPFTTIAYVGDDSGLLVLDVSDPAAVVQLGAFPLANPALDVDTVDVAFFNGVVYVAAGDSGLEILDVSDPANIRRLGSFSAPGQRALSLDRNGSTVYLGETSNALEGAVRILDVSDPSNITQLGVRDAGIPAAEDVLIDGSTVFVAASDGGLQLLDVGNPANPTVLGSFIAREATAVVIDGTTVYLGTPNGLAVLDASDPSTINELGFFATSQPIGSVDSEGPILSITDFSGAFQVLNTTDPANIETLGTFALPPSARGFDIEGRIAYVANGTGGVQILRGDLVAESIATLLNDDTATLQIANASALEDSGTMTFTVTLSAGVDTAFTVDAATIEFAGQATAGTDYTATSQTLNFAGTAGETQSVTVNLTPDSDIEPDETFGVQLSNVVASGRSVTLGANSTATGTILNDDVANPTLDVSITIADSPDPVVPGATLVYTMIVTNNGPDPATGVTVTDSLPASLTFLSGDVDGDAASISEAGGVVTATVGDLANGASATVTIAATVANSAAGSIDNTASVTSTEGDLDRTNNSATANTQVSIALTDDTLNIDEDETDPTLLLVDVLANDLPVGPLTITSLTQGSLGIATIAPNGLSIVYTPIQDAFGQDLFTYTVSDGAGQTATASVTVNVTAVNDLPVAVDDSVTAPDRGPLAIDVADLLINDSPGPLNEGQMVSISSVATVSANGGSIELEGSTISYTPNANFTGLSDSFSYTISDGTDVDMATVTIVLPPVPIVDLSTALSDDVDPVIANGSVTFIVPITNQGSISASNVVSTTTLPSEFNIVSAVSSPLGNVTITGNTVVTNLAALDAGVTSTLTILATVGNASGSFNTMTSVTSDESDSDPTNNSASELTTVVTPATITGHITCDLNGNGSEDVGEAVVGTTVFLDADGDRILDVGELSTLSDASGNYSIAGVTDPSLTIVVEVPIGCNAIPSNPGVARSVIGVGDLARSIVSADVDNDGDRDLLVASDASNSVSVLINDEGEFSLGEEILLGNRPQSIFAWESVESSVPMVAVAAIGTPSNGGFIYTLNGTSSLARIAVGNGPIEVVIDDFDNNGQSDILVAAFRSSDLQLLMNGSTESTAIATARLVHSVAAGDVNGDGNSDIVLGGYGYPGDESSQLVVRLGDGNGGFGDPITTNPISKLLSVKIADLTNDPDSMESHILALSEAGRLTVYAIENGSLSEVHSINVSPGSTSFDVGYFNPDGLTDLAIANLGSQLIDVYVGNGSGRFAKITTLTNVPAPSDIVVDDFDGDGADEIAVANLYQDANLGQPDSAEYKFPSTTTILRLDVAESSYVVSGSTIIPVDFTFPTANPEIRFDVSGDGQVTSLDALRIINAMSRIPAEGESVAGVVTNKTDVNGDGKTSAIDALMIINYLARKQEALVIVSGIDQLAGDDDDDRDDRIAAVDLVLTQLLN